MEHILKFLLLLLLCFSDPGLQGMDIGKYTTNIFSILYHNHTKVHEVQITDDENDDYGTGAMLIYFRVAAWKKLGIIHIN